MARKVLVIDDSEAIREALTAFLESEDYNVLRADDGEEGIAAIDKERPDLVISDLDMPKKSGRDVLWHVKNSYPAMKIIIITGGGGLEGMERIFLDAGCDAFFTKSVSAKEFEVFRNKIKELLGE